MHSPTLPNAALVQQRPTGTLKATGLVYNSGTLLYVVYPRDSARALSADPAGVFPSPGPILLLTAGASFLTAATAH